MALVQGQLGAVDVAGTGTLTTIYTVPASKAASVNITIANRADTATNIRVAHIKASASVANEDYLMYDFSTALLVDNRAPIIFTGIIMGAADTIRVYSSASAVSVAVNGIEDDA